ncbi:spoIIIJ-associated protein [Pilibacter termitis]|uniref:RNA-binding protein KhpB n=1 Tax=Pilibacter termitis TaxID=263852 RepID=A0A1T4NK15_9ENTE|nr:RNA-binding cell elongation regulator Jag/EloR [Pilibacter termitis]SJZ79088.1 spoIIIJ-associated protein [Pilibacter termitis]
MAIFKGRTVEEAIERGLKELGISKEKAHVHIKQTEKKGFLGFGRKLAEVEIDGIAEDVIMQADRHAVRGVPDEIRAQAEPVKSASEATVELSKVVSAVKQAEEGDAKKNSSKSEVGADKLAATVPTELASEGNEFLENLDEKTTLAELAKYLTKITKELGAPALVKISRDSTGVATLSLESTKQGILIGKHGKILNSLQYLSQVFVHRVAEGKVSVIINVGDYREKRKEVLTRLAKRTAENVKRTGQPVFLEPMPAFERKQIHAALAKDPYISTHSEGDDPYRYLVVEKSGRRI